jgi:hypothetical protein
MPPANSFPLTLSWQWHVIESDRTEFSPSREKERVVAVVELPAILGASGSKSQGGVQQDSSFLLAILVALQGLRM